MCTSQTRYVILYCIHRLLSLFIYTDLLHGITHNQCVCRRRLYYSTYPRLRVTCPFHKEVLRRYLYGLADDAKMFIDTTFGRMENNEMEGKFGVMWRDKMKGEPISHNLWEVVCGKGNLNGNKTAMQEMLGDKYESFELSILRDRPGMHGLARCG